MLNQVQKETILNWVATACDIADITPPVIAFDLKGKMGGWYIATEDKIRINVEIASRELENYKDTVLHELAHAIDYKRNGGRKSSNGKWIHHDNLFRQYMREIGGVDTSTTHNFETTPVRTQRKWLYTCDCEENIKVSTVIHNRIQKKGQVRICRTCNFHFGKNHFIKEA